jgi:hypothetical protein
VSLITRNRSVTHQVELGTWGEALHAKQIGQGMLVDHPGTLEAPAGSQALMRRPLKNLPVPLSTTLPAGSNTVNS